MAVENTGEVVRAIWRAASASEALALRESIRIYRDDWDDIVLSKIKKMFQDDAVRNRLIPLVSTEINLCKKITNERSMLYREPAQRAAVVGETSESRYDDIVKESRINSVMQAANRYTTLVNHTLIRPVIRKDKMEYDIFLPDQFELFTAENDWKEIVAIKYYTSCGNGVFSFAAGETVVNRKAGYIWVKKDAWLMHDGARVRLSEGVYSFDQSKANDPVFESEFPYKENGENVLPFALTYKEYPIESLLNFTQDSAMPDSAVMIAVLLTYLNEVIKYQSFKQMVITGDTSMNIPSPMQSGPGTIYKILSEGANGDIKAIDMNGPVKELTDTILQRAQMIAAQYGIPPSSFTLTGSPQSGYAMKMDRTALEEIRSYDMDNFRDIENELFRITRIVNNTDHSKKISEKAEFHIDFAEPKYAMTPQEEGIVWGSRISQNAATPVDWIMAENPDLTEEEATEKFIKNKAFNNPARVATLTTTPLAVAPAATEDNE